MSEIIGNVALERTQERALEQSAMLLGKQVDSLVICNDADNRQAGELLRQIKTQQKNIKAYWKSMIDDAKKVVENLRSRQNEILAPLEYAEKSIGVKMDAYRKEQDEIARHRAEQRRREAQEEADRRLDEAVQLESSGNEDAADYALAEAEMYSSIADTTEQDASTPRVDGITYKQMYTKDSIEVVDPSLVPIWVEGVEIRPIDTSAILQLVKLRKGNVSIPGIRITKTTVKSVRTY